MLKLHMSMSDTNIGQDDFTELKSNREIYYGLGETEMLVIGQFINNFMRGGL